MPPHAASNAVSGLMCFDEGRAAIKDGGSLEHIVTLSAASEKDDTACSGIGGWLSRTC